MPSCASTQLQFDSALALPLSYFHATPCTGSRRPRRPRVERLDVVEPERREQHAVSSSITTSWHAAAAANLETCAPRLGARRRPGRAPVRAERGRKQLLMRGEEEERCRGSGERGGVVGVGRRRPRHHHADQPRTPTERPCTSAAPSSAAAPPAGGARNPAVRDRRRHAAGARRTAKAAHHPHRPRRRQGVMRTAGALHNVKGLSASTSLSATPPGPRATAASATASATRRRQPAPPPAAAARARRSPAAASVASAHEHGAPPPDRSGGRRRRRSASRPPPPPPPPPRATAARWASPAGAAAAAGIGGAGRSCVGERSGEKWERRWSLSRDGELGGGGEHRLREGRGGGGRRRRRQASWSTRREGLRLRRRLRAHLRRRAREGVAAIARWHASRSRLKPSWPPPLAASSIPLRSARLHTHRATCTAAAAA